MPKMIWITTGEGERIQVRAGSWSTKPEHEQWRILEKQLEDAPLMLMRIRGMVGYVRARDVEGYDERYVIQQLNYVRAEIDATLAEFSRQRRVELLRNTEGRTAEEVEAYRKKADALEAEH